MFWTKEPEPPPKDHTGTIIIVLLLFILAKYGKKSLQFQIFKPTNKLHEVVGLETVKKEIEYYMEFIKNKKIFGLEGKTTKRYLAFGTTWNR